MKARNDRLGLTAMQAVKPPRALRFLAVVLFLLFIVLPPALMFVPWQQNVPAQGRVTALEPLDRIQTIRAPVTGQLTELNVQEGVYVEEGAVIARMSDQDERFELRLQTQLDLAELKVEFTQDIIDALESQIRLERLARDQAVAIAKSEFKAAEAEVEVAEQDLEAARAELDQKLPQYERAELAYNGRTLSKLDFEIAQREYETAKAKFEGAEAKVRQTTAKRTAAESKVTNVENAEEAKIQKTVSEQEKNRAELTEAEKAVQAAQTDLARQETQVIRAPRSGYVQRVDAATTSEFMSVGTPLIELVPDTRDLAVELWVRGIDAPLISPGRKVRIQFEGWPAVQFAGWPSVAVGTFGGIVGFVDAHGNSDGMFRVLVLPDPEELEGWPPRQYLRQGVRANGWLLLNSVSIGKEIWRQLNAFPPSVPNAPGSRDSMGGKSTPDFKKNGSGGSKGKP